MSQAPTLNTASSAANSCPSTGASLHLSLALLKVSSCRGIFFLPTVACWGQALGFCHATRDPFVCNIHDINKDECSLSAMVRAELFLGSESAHFHTSKSHPLLLHLRFFLKILLQSSFCNSVCIIDNYFSCLGEAGITRTNINSKGRTSNIQLGS